jgi:hypothetical protein
MTHVYQPVMLIELLRNNGNASVEQIAKAILDKDPTQIEYFARMPSMKQRQQAGTMSRLRAFSASSRIPTYLRCFARIARRGAGEAFGMACAVFGSIC